MSLNFYDVNFNQEPIDQSNSIPAISGYIINDYGYEHRNDFQGDISWDYFFTTAQATNSIQGAIGMDRVRINTDSGQIVACRLQPDGHHLVYTQYTDAGPINVIICDESGDTVEQLTLPYLEGNNNLSFVGHFDENEELDWVSVGYAHRNSLTNEPYVFINTTGFSSTIKDEMKPYIYLKYKYEYQVVIQKTLSGTDDFQISRFPADWFNLKTYGTGEGQSQKYNDVVCRLDPEDQNIFDKSAVFGLDPYSSAFPYNHYDGGNSRNNENYNLALAMAAYLENNGYSFGSDILRKMPDGKYYNGVDLSVANIAWPDISPGGDPYDIEFKGGKIRLCFSGLNRYIQILDSDNNVIDQYQMPYPVSGGGSTIKSGEPAYVNYTTLMNVYLAEYNNHYYLFGLYQYDVPMNDDDGNRIEYPGTGLSTGFIRCSYYRILKSLNVNANNLLYRATDAEKIVPADPDSLTGDDVSNQTSDSDNKNELGNEIPTPRYNDGEWDDHSTDGIRGSDQGQQIGYNPEGKLDQQPGLPGIPNIPSVTSTDFMHLFAPSDGEIQQLGQQLADDDALSKLQKYLGNNPLDFIVGLHVVPGSYSLSTKKYKIDYGLFQSSPSMYAITDEFCEMDYGTLDLKQIYASWQDFNPHTKMSIYLPYIGIKDIDPDRVNGTMLSLKYYVDATTGSILARLTSIRKDNANNGAEYLVGQWAGQASYTIPVTNVQHDASINAIISLVGAAVGVGMAVGTGGASAMLTAGAAASVGNAALSAAKSQKTDITMQGAVSGSLAFFTAPDAYIQIEFPIQGRPDDYDHIIGMPSNITTDIAHQPQNNYIEFVNVDVSGIDAPPDEKNAIIELLKGGIYT